MEAEFAGPQWVFGLSDYGIDADGTVVASSFAMGDMRLWAVAPGAAPRDLGVSADEIDYLRVRDGVVTLIGGFATRPRALMTLDLRSGREERLRESSSLAVDPGYLSVPRHIAFPTSGGRTAYAWYYPPTNPDAVAPEGRGAAARGHVARRADKPGARGAEP